MNLGQSPWRGLPDDPHTVCGCFPSKHAAKGQKSMIRKPTQDEKVQAILDARQKVAEYLRGINRLEAFNDFTKDEIAGLIRVCQEGVQESLKRQAAEGFGAGGRALDDEIPFAPEFRI